jgi:hypothetical protein
LESVAVLEWNQWQSFTGIRTQLQIHPKAFGHFE